MATVSNSRSECKFPRSRFANRRFRGTSAAAGKQKHQQPENQQDNPPIEAHVNAQRLLVARGIANRAIDDQNQSEQRKQSPQRKSNIDAHQRSYQKIIFNNTVPATTIMANEAGRACQASGSSSGRGVIEYTSPTSLLSSGARVSRLTTMVTTKQVLQA